jgi:hypothetical protein
MKEILLTLNRYGYKDFEIGVISDDIHILLQEGIIIKIGEKENIISDLRKGKASINLSIEEVIEAIKSKFGSPRYREEPLPPLAIDILICKKALEDFQIRLSQMPLKHQKDTTTYGCARLLEKKIKLMRRLQEREEEKIKDKKGVEEMLVKEKGEESSDNKVFEP